MDVINFDSMSKPVLADSAIAGGYLKRRTDNRARRIRKSIALATLVPMFWAFSSVAQSEEADDRTAMIDEGTQFLIDAAEPAADESLRQWPYEGVYRVRGEIPIGYRVGGTAIVAEALIQTAAGDSELLAEPERRAAIDAATNFIVNATGDRMMGHRFQSTYDVRGWGYAYGLGHLLRVRRLGLIPAPMEGADDGSPNAGATGSATGSATTEAIDVAIQFYLDGIQLTAIPENGGWNYARRAGFDEPGAPSPFMTGPTLLALFEAHQQGFAVDAAMVTAALNALEAGRTPAGGYVYAGDDGARSREAVPGSVGRMLVAESTLLLAGRGSVDRVRGAIDAFIVHWDWLDQRRAQSGTHVAPYGVAPYYFYFAHYFAAKSIELLPPGERAEYRRRLAGLIESRRLENGTWNDRVFDRSANYGTAMALLSLTMEDAHPTPRWLATSDRR